MINFEKELKNFQPSLEVEEAEAAIYNHDLTCLLYTSPSPRDCS